jgi:acyl carrier protein
VPLFETSRSDDMSTAVFDEVQQTVAEVFALDAAEVSAESSAESIPAWDSLGHLNLILALEQRFDISFDPEEVPKLTSVAALAEAVSQLQN